MSRRKQSGAMCAAALLALLCAACRPSPAAPAGATQSESIRSPAPVAAVLTTDVGAEIDDQWALAHLLLSEEIDLRAIITTHASSIGLTPAMTAEEAGRVLSHVLPEEAPRPSIVAGAATPLQQNAPAPADAGVDLLIQLSRPFSPAGRLTVFVIGAATDVAAALVEDPAIADRIAVVAMGFDDYPAGGDPFNVRNDPRAWEILLDSDVPLVIGSTALTRRTLRLTRAEAAALMRPHGPIGEYLYAHFEEWVTRQAPLVAQTVAPDTWVIWDEVVVAYALGMARGDEVPRPRLQPDLLFAHPRTDGRIIWLREIDTARLWADFTDKIDRRRQ